MMRGKLSGKKRRILLAVVAATAFLFGLYGYGQMRTFWAEAEYRQFLKAYEARAVPLKKEATSAYYQAITSGRDEDYAQSTRLNLQLNDIYLDRTSFEKLKAFKESGRIKDPLLRRQLDMQYIAFVTSLSDKSKVDELTARQNELEKKFYTFRTAYGGKSITDNEVEEILRTSKDSKQLKKVWEESKKVGELMGGDIVSMAKMRNQIARDLGFADYQKMALALNEQDPAEMDKLFDDLDAATRGTYQKAKEDIDRKLAEKYGIPVSELRPWHYQNRYFQEVPAVFDVDLDSLYKDKDVLALAKSYYAGLGMPIDDLVAGSDLYERPGKYQHAIAFDIDREGDIRVIANIRNNNYWMHTLLHEYGHALYFQNIDRTLPWELRAPSNIFTTEAVAVLFQDMVYSPEWMRQDLGLPDGKVEELRESAQENSRLFALIFSRWTQVMYRFEKGLYENPDQDLNKLWWDLVEEYQLVQRPEGRSAPDWATKIHIISTPVYYHNYTLGYLYASQLRHHINADILETDEKYLSYSGKKEVGAYLAKEVFSPGTRYGWKELIRRSTGEELNLGYFAREVAK